MDEQLLFMLQFCDSNFPSGAFTQSFGLETYIQEGTVHDKESFFQWLFTYLSQQLVYADGLAIRLSHELIDKEDWSSLWSLDRLITIQNSPREAREGNRRMGERMVRLAVGLVPSPPLLEYQQRITDRVSSGHPALVFGLLSKHLRVPTDTAVVSYLYSALAPLVQNGVRAIPLGQTDGQALLWRLHPYLLQAVKQIQSLSLSDFGSSCPGLERAQMHHEHLETRMFMS